MTADAAVAAARARSGLRAFVLVLAALVVSAMGGSMKSFALNVSVYQETGSASLYAVVSAAAFLPQIVVAPIAGFVADRWGTRAALVASQVGVGACSLLIALLLGLSALGLPTLVVLVALTSTFAALQTAAIVPAMTLLVVREHHGRANGLLQLRLAIPQILAPAAAGALLPAVGVGVIVLVDVLTCGLAVVALRRIGFPRPAIDTVGVIACGSTLAALAITASFLRRRRGLAHLLGLIFSRYVLLGAVMTLITPMVLGLADTQALGSVLALGGVGFLVGSVIMTLWGGPRRRVLGELGFLFVQGMLMLLGAWRPSLSLVSAGVFGVLLVEPLIGGCSTALWQRQIPLDMQGRVFGVRAMIAAAGMGIGILVAGPLNDLLFEPWMANEAARSSTLVGLLGAGAGRGTALLFMICGALAVLTAVVAALDRHIWRADEPTAAASEST